MHSIASTSDACKLWSSSLCIYSLIVLLSGSSIPLVHSFFLCSITMVGLCHVVFLSSSMCQSLHGGSQLNSPGSSTWFCSHMLWVCDLFHATPSLARESASLHAPLSICTSCTEKEAHPTLGSNPGPLDQSHNLSPPGPEFFQCNGYCNDMHVGTACACLPVLAAPGELRFIWKP